MPDSAVDIVDLLRDLGFDTPTGAQQARAALIEEKLTNAHKTRIDGAKRPRVEDALRQRFLVTCGAPACNREANGRIAVIAQDRARCWVCGGSNNARAVQLAEVAFRNAGVRRIVIVGGSPVVHDELRQLAPASWELRLIDGTDRRTRDQAQGDRKWADLVIIWGGTELDHKVSTLYTPQGEARTSTVMVNRRGIAALLDQAARFVAARNSR